MSVVLKKHKKLYIADIKLVLVVSETDEEVKNVDKNISSARDTLFSFLGNICSYKCELSPIVQHYKWSVYIKSVLRSGLAALPIRPPVINTISTFHKADRIS